MKYLLIIISITLLCSRLTAAIGPVPRSIVFRTHADTCLTTEDRMANLREEIKYYKGMKATGAGLTGLGAVFFVTGQALLWSSVALNQSGKRNYSPTARDPMWLSGLGATVLTAVPFAFGIPLLRYGSKKVKELSKQLPKRHLQ